MLSKKGKKDSPSEPKVEPTKLRKFKAVVQDHDGKTRKVALTAETRGSARLQLANQGLAIVELKEKKSLLEIEIGSSVSQEALLQMTRQLAAFSGAGVPILDSLLLLAQSSKSKKLRSMLIEIANEIRDGETLPQAARNHDDIFPRYYLSILEASERTGQITETFETLASYLERDLASTRAVKSAMYYPIILISISLIAVIILSTTVLPKFALFFASLNTSLPLSTRILMNISAFFSGYWPLVLLFIVALLIAFVLFRRTPAGRLTVDVLLLKIPIFGQIIQIIILERFTRVMGSLTGADVPLPDSLELAAGAMGNKSFSNAITDARNGVLRGEGLSAPLEESGVFPQETVQILRVGEQSGFLTEQLGHASTFYAKEVDYKLKNITSLVEPVVLVVVGGGVGFVAIALVSAMYGIYSSSSLNG